MELNRASNVPSSMPARSMSRNGSTGLRCAQRPGIARFVFYVCGRRVSVSVRLVAFDLQNDALSGAS